MTNKQIVILQKNEIMSENVILDFANMLFDVIIIETKMLAKNVFWKKRAKNSSSCGWMKSQNIQLLKKSSSNRRWIKKNFERWRSKKTILFKIQMNTWINRKKNLNDFCFIVWIRLKSNYSTTLLIRRK